MKTNWIIGVAIVVIVGGGIFAITRSYDNRVKTQAVSAQMNADEAAAMKKSDDAAAMKKTEEEAAMKKAATGDAMTHTSPTPTQ